VLYMLRQ